MKGTLVNRNGHWSIRISEGKDPNDPTGKIPAKMDIGQGQ